MKVKDRWIDEECLGNNDGLLISLRREEFIFGVKDTHYFGALKAVKKYNLAFRFCTDLRNINGFK